MEHQPHPGPSRPSWWPERNNRREAVLSILRHYGHGITPGNLMSQHEFDGHHWPNMQAELEAMENDRLIILHRDSSAGQRHSKEFNGITLVCLRPKEL